MTGTAPHTGDGSPDRAAGPLCRCGHRKLAHEHYRTGTDCALCDCRKFRRALPGWLQRVFR